VTLTANYNLMAGSTVTISVLTGSKTADASALSVSTGSLLGSTGVWTQSAGRLVLTATSGGTTATTPCVVTFDLTNTDTDQSSPMVKVEAVIRSSGTSIGTIAETPMSKTDSNLFGVIKGANPLEVLIPFFSVRSIRQRTPISGAKNTLTVTLQANYNLKAGSMVTILGLTGSQTLDASNLTVSSSGVFGTSGAWMQTGILVLTATSTGSIARTSCVVKFDLTNTATAQTSPAVSVVASIKDNSNSIGSIMQVAMIKPGTALFGVANGADPLTVLEPSFGVKSISISTAKVTMVVQMSLTLAGLDKDTQVFNTLVYPFM